MAFKRFLNIIQMPFKLFMDLVFQIKMYVFPLSEFLHYLHDGIAVFLYGFLAYTFYA